MIITALIEVVPDHSYKKYIQFYVGLVIVLMLCSPIIKVIGMEDNITSLYYNNTYRNELKELQEKTEFLNEVSIYDYIS